MHIMEGQKSLRQGQGLQQPPAIHNSWRPSSRAALHQLSKENNTHRNRVRPLRVVDAPERELQTVLADDQR